MGRRPNPLILEYFERGSKLEDASNRYQHTCKSCGENFPKGRADSLINHLIKKCPALPHHDRARAQQQQHDFSDLGLPALSHPANGQFQHAQTMNLPFAPSKQELSALETLAEVSRRHLDLSDKRAPAQQQQQQQQHQQQKVQLQQSPHAHDGGNHHDFEFLVDDGPHEDLGTLSQSLDVSGVPSLPSIYQFNGQLQHSPTDSPHMGGLPLGPSASMAQMAPSSLVMAASQANELMPMTHGGLTMEPELNMPNAGSGSDKFFHSQARQWSNSLDPLLPDHVDHEQKEHMLPNDMGAKSSTLPRPIAMNPHTQTHFTTDFSVDQKPSKPKVRGRFTNSRRKEVQEVRKRGACIRCRMLKKPCSGGDPCVACHSVERARLWKQPCIRTRIAEEFNLYSAGLFGVLGFHAVSQAKNQIRLNQMPGRIEATHYPDSGIFATFTPLKCQSQLHGQEIDPSILASLSPTQLEIIDSDDDISGKVDLYIKKINDAFWESETSAFMKATINTALSVKSDNADNLLMKVLELWNLTRILTSPDMEWHFFSNPSLSPALAPSILTSSDLETINRSPITSAANNTSYELIKMQLMGATEKRAASLARIVMHGLEKRLLARQQASPFETFIIAVVLLSCVERMCWLFRTWEEDQTPTPGDHARTQPLHHQTSTEGDIAQALQSLPPDGTLQTAARHPKWPFDKQPAYYSQQGERFSDILLMVLKMRSVPPKPQASGPDGMLVMWGSDAAREWYENISVTGDLLTERCNARFVGADPKEWELKYVSKIISGI
ncbi:hypothetical protein P280DRAFT_431982 [Massarina eburnea CBS 473.64]|uniref:Zn(2)-C6 fungal-type domain-containing protein n=1 Tax=Massarina eburnea CBS 473.64 TaxID=1395130 RepID=A0A6A6RRX0_9PLEO|nr:hypothetical protein P280DRAFT_431982 [Massarina eburnea CBS 473.64]